MNRNNLLVWLVVNATTVFIYININIVMIVIATMRIELNFARISKSE